MIQEKRTVCFDNDLKIEAYRFEGIMQKFPNHFHECYVLGFIESGRRRLSCKNVEYTIDPGDLLLFNPLDNHACEQIDEKALDYRCINVGSKVMQKIMLDITGREYLPQFTQTVAYHSEAVPLLRELHQMIMDKHIGFEKEEAFYFLIEQLVSSYTELMSKILSALSPEIQSVCGYVESHFSEIIALDDLSKLSGLNKYTLLRNFTKQRGITPYQYLESVRVNEAKKLLENGLEPIEAAMRTGFVDQSHFTRFF